MEQNYLQLVLASFFCWFRG